VNSVSDPSDLNSPQPSTWWQVWQKVRTASLTPGQLASPLMKRPYDLRHSGVTWRLNSGVPATEVAAWAGHSVEVLTRVWFDWRDATNR
jgi:integrase